MWLIIKTHFKDDRDEFFHGERRWMEDRVRAGRIMKAGWAEAEDPELAVEPDPAPGNVALDVQGSTHASKDTARG